MLNTIDAPAFEGSTNTADRDLGLATQVDQDEVRDALRGVIDPEMGLNIIDLGLVYHIDVEGDEAYIEMTLTSPGCPMGPYIMSETKKAAESVDGVTRAEIDLVWEPYWTSDRIDLRVRALMGL